MELTWSVSYTYGKATLTRFEEILEEYNLEKEPRDESLSACKYRDL